MYRTYGPTYLIRNDRLIHSNLFPMNACAGVSLLNQMRRGYFELVSARGLARVISGSVGPAWQDG